MIAIDKDIFEQYQPHEIVDYFSGVYPQLKAIDFEGETWSYQDLSDFSAKLAGMLDELSLPVGTRVGVYGNRSGSFVCSLIAVFKSGCTAVILDDSYPLKRTLQLLNITDVSVVIDCSSRCSKACFITERNAVVTTIPAGATKESVFDLLKDCERISLVNKYSGDDTAYILFTSGTTGKPKAVKNSMIPLQHFLIWHIKKFGLWSFGSFGMLSGIAHDPVLRDIFSALMTGGTLYIPSQETRFDGTKLFNWLLFNSINVINMTPALAKLLLNTAKKRTESLDRLNLFFFGGEILRVDIPAEILAIAPNVKCINYYGSTETPQAQAFYVIDVRSSRESVPVGVGIDGVGLYVLDSNLKPVKKGEYGDIYIESNYLSQGYTDGDLLFVTTEILGRTCKLFKIGDQGYINQDNQLEVLGRADGQLIFNGCRFSPVEIEQNINAIKGIKDSFVTICGDEYSRKLCAFCVVQEKEPCKLDQRTVREFLAQDLPSYMLPNTILFVDKMILTSNGKVDTASMLRNHRRVTRDRRFTDNLSKVEQDVYRLWVKRLGITDLNKSDNFFDVGGTSLAGLELVDDLNLFFETSFSSTELLTNPTIENMAGLLNEESIEQTVDEKINQIFDTLETNIGKYSECRNNENFRMRESWFCRNILFYLYCFFTSETLRSILQKLILRLEGRNWFSVTMRRIYKKCYDMEIGDYSSSCFDFKNFKRGTKFGRYCDITSTARFETANHPSNLISSHGIFYQQSLGFSKGFSIPRSKIVIGNDVHIGHNVSILYPVDTIGDGAIIGAGSVVTFNVPPYAVVGGTPARIIRYRFSPEVIQRLLEIRWWEYSLEELYSSRDLFFEVLEGNKIN